VARFYGPAHRNATSNTIEMPRTSRGEQIRVAAHDEFGTPVDRILQLDEIALAQRRAPYQHRLLATLWRLYTRISGRFD
jgi:hypothetical protein